MAVVRQNQAALLPVNNCQELQWLGQMVSASQLFGETNPAVGLSIVAMCQQERKSWLWFMENLHMIKGRVSKKTDAMLADFHRLGGSHKVVTRSSEKAEATFKLGESEYTSSITWQDCLAEPFIYLGKESDVVEVLDRGNEAEIKKLKIKPKYRTPRARMQMLWARCVSDGVRVVAPECCQGLYTPEETSDFVPDTNPVPAQGSASPAPYEAPKPAPEMPEVVDIEVCPAGDPRVAGKRWDDESAFSLEALKFALTVEHPAFTPEMKDYIRGVIAKREAAAKNENTQGEE